jgi:rhamnose utilization protein RhaD (predicted bifunctional aldolase and dehydrogenase)/NAD(P)-dependent dehydrogenase (short-subunit alcohol dehydrogenase family)
MKSLWKPNDAKKAGKGLLAQRVYSSRLLGAAPDLVLHGGGNTSVKARVKDFYGVPTDVLYVKGSGWDLATIEGAGFSPCRMESLLKMAEMDRLSDSDMVQQCRAAMLDPGAPAPSIEAIVHAVIPHRFVDHTHADAVVALTNAPGGKARIEEVYGDRILVIPYVMPGFELAKAIHKALAKVDPSKLDGLVLMNHGIFTFHHEARKSYALMVELVTLAEQHIAKKLGKRKAVATATAKAKAKEDLPVLAEVRRLVSQWRGLPSYALLENSPEAVGYSNRKDIKTLATRGPLTPDHVIRTKRVPVVLDGDPAVAIDRFADSYAKYFNKHNDGSLTMLDPAPRWAVWPGHGTISFGATQREAGIVADIAAHTIKTQQLAANALGGWRALPASKLFEIEYWELEQAKLRSSGGAAPIHAGKVAIVSGSAAGIGFACAEALVKAGAAVVGLDLNPDICEVMASIGAVGKVVNLTDEKAVIAGVEATILEFGGLDIVVSNAGIFTAGAYLEDMVQSNWDKSIAVNLTSHQVLLKHCVPYVKAGIDGAVVLVGSRNVNAPGAGAASYSCAKAGLTQLCRVAALELAPHGVRCNIVHPDAVFDTKLWTPEALKRSAERYGITIEEYKTRNLMKTEIRSVDVGAMVSSMAGPLFGKTTGTQVPVDGGNDRVI